MTGPELAEDDGEEEEPVSDAGVEALSLEPVLEGMSEEEVIEDEPISEVGEAATGTLLAASPPLLPHALSNIAVTAIPARALARIREPGRTTRTVITILFDS